MKTILVIENDPADFKDIQNNLSDWDIFPNELTEIKSFEIKTISRFVLDALSNNPEIVALIVDISLTGDIDKTGLELIRNIRSKSDENISNKIIPIFCYSRHDDLKVEAFKAGATNFFTKDSLINSKDTRYLFLRQSLQALAFLYLDAMDYAQRLSTFNDIMDQLKQSKIDTDIILRSVLQLSTFSDLDSLLNSGNIEDLLINRLGKDEVEELKKIKLEVQNKEQLLQQLDEIADVLCSIPVLSPFAGIFKGIKLFTHSLW